MQKLLNLSPSSPNLTSCQLALGLLCWDMSDEQSKIKSFPNAASAQPARAMPHNLPAEQNLLGAILLDNSVFERIDDRLLADHFYDPLHGRNFRPFSASSNEASLQIR